MDVLAIIPAQGGSKGIPQKNIQKLDGRPLIEFTIKAAKNSKKISRIIVSTDDRKIAHFSKSLGVEVPFLRPKRFSHSRSPTIETVRHTLKFLQIHDSYVPDIVLILQPTSPLRTTKIIDKSIRLLKNSNATSVLGVTNIKQHPYLSFSLKSKYLKPFKSNFKKYYQRQRFTKLFYPTGSIYTFWLRTLKKYGDYYGPRIKPLIIPYEDSIDIDNIFDLFIAEIRIFQWEKYKKRFSKNNSNIK